VLDVMDKAYLPEEEEEKVLGSILMI